MMWVSYGDDPNHHLAVPSFLSYRVINDPRWLGDRHSIWRSSQQAN
ncbi:MAG: hypothetical protein AAFR31_11910 [Cyanobacteria bacterium J06627_8]